jgi:two-component system response regulator
LQPNWLFIRGYILQKKWTRSTVAASVRVATGVIPLITTQNTILLVEDDPVEIELARRVCEAYEPPLELVVVKDSDEALEWLSRGSDASDPLPRLILLDLKLPKLLGLAMLRRLRMDARTWDLPIIVYSRNHEPSDVVLSYKVGANSFVNKPENVEQFGALLRELTAYWLQPRQRKLAFAAR